MKILIVSHNPFSKISNNGKTLESIFKRFAKEELSQMYFVEDFDIDQEYADSYLKITDKDIILRRKLHQLSKLDTFSKEKAVVKKGSKFYAYLRRHKHKIAFVRDYLWKFSRIYSNEAMHNWIKRQSPDLIFFVGGNQIFSHDIFNNIIKRHKVKSAVYFTDDYVFSTHNSGFLQIKHYEKLCAAYSETIANADLCFGISDLMCKKYSEYYKKQFLPIMNSIDLNLYKDIIKENSSKNEIIVSYFGSLHLNRDKMIISLGNLFSRIKEVKIVIYLYTASEINMQLDSIFKNNNIFFKGKVQGDNLYHRIINSDILLHTESDDPFYRALTKLSVSTKIPEYLLSRNLILAYGPVDVASLRLLKDNDLACILNSEDSDKKNINTLLDIINNKHKKERLIDNAYQYALKKFDEEKISSNFRYIIESEIRK